MGCDKGSEAMRRIDKWNNQKRNACLSEFRRMIAGCREAQIENAITAGRSLAKLMLDGHVTITGIDGVQMERFRRQYAVVPHLKHVMYAVATGQLTDDLLEQRLNRKFPAYRLPSGRLRLVARCALCSKRTCRCVPADTRPAKQRKQSPAHPLVGTVVSVRGLNQ